MQIFVAHLPTGDYLFVITDEYSRFPVVEIVKSVSASAVIPVLDKVLSDWGGVRQIKTDNGSPFNSHGFDEFARHSGFHHRKITPRWPRANAQAEVFNKPLMKAVRAAVVEGKTWKQQLYVFLRQYRATPHPSTGFTPYRLLLGREPRTKLPELGSRPEDLVHLTARQRDARAKRKMKAYADRNIQARQSNIQVGDRVLVRAETRNKLSPAYIPREYTVTHKRGNMVTAESHDHMVTRNSSRFKPSSAKPTPEEIPDLDEEPFSPAAEAAAKQAPSNPGEPSASPTPEKRVLPCRNRRPPKYLNDFVT